jgi:uncharacterized protein YjiS (DUF1127 family)
MYHANTPSPVACLKCGAQPGELCRSKSGRVASQWHTNREVRSHLKEMTPAEREEMSVKIATLRTLLDKHTKPVPTTPEPKSLIRRIVSTVTRWVA